MRTTFKILFLCKSAVNKNGKSTIIARITIDGKRVHISTNYEIAPDQWHSGQANPKSKEGKHINAGLEEIKIKLRNCYEELYGRFSVVTAEMVKSAYQGGYDEKPTMIMELFNEFNTQKDKEAGKKITMSTYRKYLLVALRLKQFMVKQYGVTDMNVKDITPSFVKAFHEYLITECDLSHNVAVKSMQKFKTVVFIAKDNGIITTNPFCKYHFRFKKVDRGYLNENELQLLLNKRIVNNRLASTKDVFLFSCFTGLAYIDIYNLRSENIVTGQDGRKWIYTSRKKTDTKVKVPLLPIAETILRKYEGVMTGGKLLPVYSNQRTNSYLKEIAGVCDIDKDLTFHMARHTFATIVTLQNGVPIESVSKMLGHTNIQTTQIYARILDKKISQDMSKVSAILAEHYIYDE